MMITLALLLVRRISSAARPTPFGAHRWRHVRRRRKPETKNLRLVLGLTRKGPIVLFFYGALYDN
jgi:hypothetical protein